MEFTFPSGTYRFWTGQGILTYSGNDYTGAGSLIDIQQIDGVSDLSSVPLLVTLTSVPNSDLSPDVLATIEAETWHQAPVKISRAYIDPDTRTLLSVERFYSGYIDKIDHEDQIGGGAVLKAYSESKSRDHLKTGYRTRSDADQRLINATDGGLMMAATAGVQDIFWGRINQNAGSTGHGSGVQWVHVN
jgi:hypothetical protein